MPLLMLPINLGFLVGSCCSHAVGRAIKKCVHHFEVGQYFPMSCVVCCFYIHLFSIRCSGVEKAVALFTDEFRSTVCRESLIWFLNKMCLLSVPFPWSGGLCAVPMALRCTKTHFRGGDPILRQV